jgi:Raf kinase inhibitor-like YbhB/YbcL family protein
MHRLLPLSSTLSLAAVLAACSPQSIHQQVNGSLQVTSTSATNGAIADRAGCKGPGLSPEVSWSSPPPGTKSFALVMDDRESIVGHLHRHYFTHWLAFNMPAERRELTEGLQKQPLPDGTQQGKSDVGNFGYFGPCPNAGSTHHYAITVYALDTTLGLPADTTGRQLLPAIDGHILARGEFLGTYSH